MTRKIAFDAIENFRDFGDYAAGPRRIKRGRLYRSAHQAEATDADLEALRALDLSVIVDLRRPNERERSPNRRWEGFTARVIENDIGQVGDDPWHLFMQDSDLSPTAFTTYMVDYYRDAPFVDRHVDLYSRYFHALSEMDGPVLIHCAAGKDRTGILAALTHHLAGVNEADILADFLLTNDPDRFARRVPLMTATIEENTGRRPTEEAVITALGVEARYLDTAFAAIHARHGTLDAYLEEILGVDADRREAIAHRILD
ncbi:MAG: tyrosine-protein phosphatase [Caulobacter sp.]|nr:tyrosine-protein phosphatase [Caulobacter sp.]